MADQKRLTDIALFSALVLVFAAVVGLGVAQISWVRRSAENESFRLREAMGLHVSKAIRDATDEAWYIADLWREASRSDEEIATNALFERVWSEWSANTEHPELIVSMWHVVVADQNQPEIRWFDPEIGTLVPENGDVTFDALPIDGAGVASRADIVVRLGNDRHRQRVAIVDLDETYILRTLIPTKLDAAETGFGTVIRDTDDNVLYNSGVDRSSDPDVRLPINLRRFGGDRPPISEFAGSQEALAVVTERYRQIETRDWERPRDAAAAFVELYRSGGSIAALQRQRSVSNATFATAVLATLLAALVSVLALYRRSRDIVDQQREFVAATGHELRTPVAVIRSSADNLRLGLVNDHERIRSYGASIAKNADRLSRGIDNVMVFAGLQARPNPAMRAMETNLEELTAQLVDDLTAAATSAGATLEAVIDGVPTTAPIDPDTIRTVVENLVQNALVHAVPYAADDAKRVDLTIRGTTDNSLQVVVEDRGPGIDRRERKHVFRAFQRGSRSRNDHVPGHGLGLHIVSRIVHLHGGRVDLASPARPGSSNGTRVEVVLPLHGERLA